MYFHNISLCQQLSYNHINNCCINCTTLYENSIVSIYGVSRLPPLSGDSKARIEPQCLE
jgi:hypothetical protein